MIDTQFWYTKNIGKSTDLKSIDKIGKIISVINRVFHTDKKY